MRELNMALFFNTISEPRHSRWVGQGRAGCLTASVVLPSAAAAFLPSLGCFGFEVTLAVHETLILPRSAHMTRHDQFSQSPLPSYLKIIMFVCLFVVSLFASGSKTFSHDTCFSWAANIVVEFFDSKIFGAINSLQYHLLKYHCHLFLGSLHSHPLPSDKKTMCLPHRLLCYKLYLWVALLILPLRFFFLKNIQVTNAWVRVCSEAASKFYWELLLCLYQRPVAKAGLPRLYLL